MTAFTLAVRAMPAGQRAAVAAQAVGLVCMLAALGLALVDPVGL